MMRFSPKSRVWVLGPTDEKLRLPGRRPLQKGLAALRAVGLPVLRFVARLARRARRTGRRVHADDITRNTRDQNWRLNCIALPLVLLAAPRTIPLALGDGFSVSLAVFQLVFSAVVSITLWRLSAWQRRYEGLEGKLHETTTRLVDERFRAMTHEINGHVQGLLLALEEMKVRIQNGDVELRGLGERDQRIELAVAAKIDLLKDYIRDFAAGKKDLEKHECAFERKLGTVEQKLVDLASTVAVISERVRE